MNRTIIHLLAGAGLLAGLATSCSQESKDGPVGEPGAPVTHSVVITARIADVLGTRVDIAGTDGDNFTWSAGDAIAVLTATGGGSYETATLSDGAGEATGTFSGEFSADIEASGYSLYPASIADNARHGSPLGVTLPAEYAITGSMADFSPLPMLANNADDPLVFNHMGGVFRITCDNVPAGTKYIKVTTDAGIQGAFEVAAPGSDAPFIAAAEVAAGNNTVQFTLASALSAETDGVVLNLPVPTGVYHQMLLEAFDGEDTKLSQASLDGNRSMPRTRGRKLTADLSADAARMWTFTVADQQVSLGDQTVSFTIQNASGTDITSGYTLTAVSGDAGVLTVGAVDLAAHTLAVTGVAKGTTTLTCTAVCGSDVMVAVATIIVKKPAPAGFGGPFTYNDTEYYISQGNMYKTETGYALYDDWTGGLDTYGVGVLSSANQEATGNMCFNWILLAGLFDTSIDTSAHEDIDNSATPIEACMLPSAAQWTAFTTGTDRSGASVDGTDNCRYALIQLTDITYYNNIPNPVGLLLLPDGATLTGMSKTFTWNTASTEGNTGVTLAELQEYIAEDCVFLPEVGSYYSSGRFWEFYGGRYWSASAKDYRFAHFLLFDNYDDAHGNARLVAYSTLKNDFFFPVRLIREYSANN